MELCTNGALIDLLIERGPIKEEKLLKHLFVQICKGVQALHTVAKFAHLDLKPDNILIGDDYLLKLTDFGFAQPASMDILKAYGTPGYEAPEILERQTV